MMNFESNSPNRQQECKRVWLEDIPALESISDYFEDAYEQASSYSVVSSSQKKEFKRSAGMSRNVEQASHKFGLVVVSNCTDEGTDMKELLKSIDIYEPKMFPDRAVLEHYAQGLESYINNVRELKNVIAPVIEDVAVRLDDKKFAYDLINMLASPSGTLFSSSERLGEEDSLRLVVAQSGYKENQGNFSGILLNMLHRGDFNQAIAKDILHNQLSTINDDPLKDAAPRSDFVKMYRLASLLDSRPEDELIDLMSSETYLEYWPDGCKKIFDEKISSIAHGVSSGLFITRKALNNAGLLILDEGPEALAQAYKEYYPIINEVKERKSLGYQGSKKRGKKAKQARIAARQGMSEMQIPKQLEPRKLTFIDEKGEIIEGDPKYDKTIAEYLDSHKGDKELHLDVQSILDYLRKLDFSKGIVRGVKKYVHAMDSNGVKENLYALKPKEAPGLSTSSAIAKKMRVLFVQNQERIGIVAITDRDNLVKIERGMGRSTGASK